MPINLGDNLEPLMAGTGWAATQTSVEALKVNAYADNMAAWSWQWLPLNRRKPIILD